MFKILAFLIIIIFGAYFVYKAFQLSLFSKSEIVSIKADNIEYKNIPSNKDGFNFVGDSLTVYNITREKILPREVVVNKKEVVVNKKEVVVNKKEVVVNKKEVVVNKKEKIKPQKNIINNLYLQLASYKNIKKAKQLINSYKDSSDLILSKLNFNIAIATISDRGTYYRVRVGPYKNIKDIYKLCLDFKVKDNECLIVKDK